MESTLINTREDLDLLAGTPAHAAAMAMLRGSLWRLEKDDTAKTWRAVQDESTVARFGMSLANFPGAIPPLLPDYVLPPVKTVLELDIEKYKRRADAKPLLMAKMAAMNVGRLKNGTWTTGQLVSLMADPEIKSLVSHMETLSFELAIGVINGLTNPLITPAIKSVWVAELTAAL